MLGRRRRGIAVPLVVYDLVQPPHNGRTADWTEGRKKDRLRSIYFNEVRYVLERSQRGHFSEHVLPCILLLE